MRTKGTLTVFDASGKPVREVTVPDVPVLPDSGVRRGDGVIDPDKTLTLAPGEYRVEVKIDVGLPALIAGETTLKIAR